MRFGDVKCLNEFETSDRQAVPQHNITSWSHPDGKKIDHFTKVGPGCTWCPWLHEQREVADELGWERYCVLWVVTILHWKYIHAPLCNGFCTVEPMRYTYQGTPIKYTTKCSSWSILHHMRHCLYCVPTCILHNVRNAHAESRILPLNTLCTQHQGAPKCAGYSIYYLGICWMGLGAGRFGEGPWSEGGTAEGGGLGFLKYERSYCLPVHDNY